MYYRIAGLFRGLKFSLELISVVYKIFVNIYLTLMKFSGINFSGFEPAQKLIPHEINQLYGIRFSIQNYYYNYMYIHVYMYNNNISYYISGFLRVVIFADFAYSFQNHKNKIHKNQCGRICKICELKN